MTTGGRSPRELVRLAVADTGRTMPAVQPAHHRLCGLRHRWQVDRQPSFVLVDLRWRDPQHLADFFLNVDDRLGLPELMLQLRILPTKPLVLLSDGILAPCLAAPLLVREAFQLASAKLPLRTTFVARQVGT